ncbi:MAG: GtrA family protein [Proteobacteria bacterium]|jgi:putative flippase GtrA|nr:GtrA family protein [Pseudomonadota bacterium]MDA1320543.1 GtrA family protein [Pseudomonadota bacterium]
MIKLQIRNELRRIIIFGIVGVGATLTHILVANLFHAVIKDRITASLVGFCLAFVFSFLAHRRFTFHDAVNGSPFRFAIVAGSGFLFSLFVLDHLASLPAWLALTLSIGVIPLWSFLMSRLWVFGFSQS